LTGELITAPTVALGVAGYLGSEILKPTLARVGESVRDFLTARVRKVFVQAETFINPSDLGPALEPGFLALFIQRVSFTEDEDELTARWAHLLADAARAFSNKHVNYVEILSQLGPVEVALLDSLVGQNSLDPRRPSNLHAVIRAYLSAALDNPRGREAASSAVTQVLQAELPWAAEVVSVEIPYVEDGRFNSAVGGVGREGWHPIALDILIRQRLVEEVTLELGEIVPPAHARVMLATGMGLDFVRVCRGIPESDPDDG
jgi:hypothetical protein